MDSQTATFGLSLICLLALLVLQTQGSNVDSMGEVMSNNMGADEAASGLLKEKPLWLQPSRTLGQIQEEDEEKQQDDSLYELIKEVPWALIQIKGRTPSFKTRLGRENQDEEMGFTKTSRSPPFAPRLGRRHKTTGGYRPRLGRLYNNK